MSEPQAPDTATKSPHENATKPTKPIGVSQPIYPLIAGITHEPNPHEAIKGLALEPQSPMQLAMRNILENFGFKGTEVEMRNATEYLIAINSGIDDARAYRATQEDISGFPVKPPRTIGEFPVTAYGNTNKLIYIALKNLRAHAAHSPDEFVELKDEDGRVFFRGTRRDRMYFMGVEECDHAIFDHTNPGQLDEDAKVQQSYKERGERMPLLAHDSLLSEMRALETKINIATKRVDEEVTSEDTLRTFEQNLIAAREYYNQQLSMPNNS